LTDLNFANNNLGEVVLTAGWRSRDGDGAPWLGPDGQQVWKPPGEADGINAIAAAIPGMGALTSLDVSDNGLTQGTLKKGCTSTYETDTTGILHSTHAHTSCNVCVRVACFIGIIGLADAIPDMEALTSLNLSLNNLKAEGGKIVAEAIRVTNNAMAVVLAPFSCPSDHWLNCCCLLLSTG
jgi:hypothetical protein